jgi:hypothetical protein
LAVGINKQSITGQDQEAAEQFEIWRLDYRHSNNTPDEALTGRVYKKYENELQERMNPFATARASATTGTIDSSE